MVPPWWAILAVVVFVVVILTVFVMVKVDRTAGPVAILEPDAFETYEAGKLVFRYRWTSSVYVRGRRIHLFCSWWPRGNRLRTEG